MKYELFGEPNGQGLRRVRALRDIPQHGVKAGDVGGWLQSESNLAQEGDSWVFGNAQVLGAARVSGDARITKTIDYLTVGPIGRENGTLTAFRCKDGIVRATRGCFLGTLDELDAASAEVRAGTVHRARFVTAIAHIRACLEATC